jgi:hypothetical protein
MPLVITGLAYASTMIGDRGTANFLAKASEELPELVEEVQAEVAKKKATAKKASAKKVAPAKKAASKAGN